MINGRPRASSALPDPEVWGYDPTANTLIKFDAATGAQLQTVSLAGLGTMTTGVSLGRDHNQLVALVGNGTTIYAFDAITGAPVGSFSTAALDGGAFTSVDGLGSTDNRTVLMDSTAGTVGMAQTIDLSTSLDTGQAVPLGKSFTPSREFNFLGGLTGVAGRPYVYATGSAHFDTSQPNLYQVGVMTATVTKTGISPSRAGPSCSRTALTSMPAVRDRPRRSRSGRSGASTRRSPWLLASQMART